LFGAACRNDAANNSSVQPSPSNNQMANLNANAAKNPNSNTIPVYGYDVVNTYKHDSKAFTQALFFHDGFLYESVGQYDKSNLRKVKIEDGSVVQSHKLKDEYFAEGAVLLNGKIYQLTYKNGVCFVYDAVTFEPLSLFRYNFGEGWGMTTNGTELIVSNGSHQIFFIDPTNFRVLRTISVFNNNRPQINLNELEWVKGEIWANIWHSEDPEYLGKPNHIVRIDPKDGKILGWIDLGGISPDDVERDVENTLNGIAYDEAGDRIFVTGKQWKKLFEIKLKPKS
jgi:glutamine cyclotransferase